MSVKRLEIDHKGLPFLDDKGVYVFYEDYAALQEKVAQREAQIAALTAENVKSRNAVSVFSDVTQQVTDIISDEIGSAGVAKILSAFKAVGNMPVTDAAVNEFRAQGVERFANQQRQIAVEQEKFGDYEFSRHCSISADEADEFAVAIRERNDG